MRTILTLLLLLAAQPAWALSPEEQAYLAARDQLRAALVQQSQNDEHNKAQTIGRPEYYSSRFRADYDRAHRTLLTQLQGLIGRVGPGRRGALSVALCCWGPVGALDGLAFAQADGGRVIVTTLGLLEQWRRERHDLRTVSSDLGSEPNFYQWSGASDWPVRKHAVLPLRLPAAASSAAAFLASGGPGAEPVWIAAFLIKSDKVHVAFVNARKKDVPREAQTLIDSFAAE
ncbi:MAG: hypothetical protein NTV97_13010 [Alphaproteobacteria bacterium]|nr:hypothetical protein [Alphaproteobacteria bacterium]